MTRNFTFLFLLIAFHGAAQIVALDNTAVPSKKRGYYDWTIFVRANGTTLNSIDHVEYLLHPTFRTPQVSSFDRNSNFSYKANGWGEFEINAKVFFKNKSIVYLKYWLRL